MVNSVAGACHRWRQPTGRGPGPNPQGQLVRCGQRKAGLMTTSVWPSRRPVRLRLGLSFLVLTQLLMTGTDEDSQLAMDLVDILEANL